MLLIKSFVKFSIALIQRIVTATGTGGQLVYNYNIHLLMYDEYIFGASAFIFFDKILST